MRGCKIRYFPHFRWRGDRRDCRRMGPSGLASAALGDFGYQFAAFIRLHINDCVGVRQQSAVKHIPQNIDGRNQRAPCPSLSPACFDDFIIVHDFCLHWSIPRRAKHEVLEHVDQRRLWKGMDPLYEACEKQRA